MKRLVLRRREEAVRGGQPVAFAAGLVFALVIGALLLTISGDPVLGTYQRMWDRSFGTADTLSATFNRAVPLALAGLAVSIAATMGLWNIGAEGQIMFGATAATLVGRVGADWPSPVLIVAMLIGAAIGGALWALGPGLAKAEIGVSEIITTLMLNEVAVRLIVYLQTGPWKDPDGFGFPQITVKPEGSQLGIIWERSHLGVLIALAVIAGFAWFVNRSVWGYELRIAGASAKTAAYAGISMRKKVLGVLVLSGAVAGFAGGIELTGTAARLNENISNGFGFAGIIVAALALMRPSGVALVAVAFGAVQVGGLQSIQTARRVVRRWPAILQALILFGAIGAAVLANVPVGPLVDRMVGDSMIIQLAALDIQRGTRFFGLVVAAIQFATLLYLAALGESHRRAEQGVLNLGVEGMMAVGAGLPATSAAVRTGLALARPLGRGARRGPVMLAGGPSPLALPLGLGADQGRERPGAHHPRPRAGRLHRRSGYTGDPRRCALRRCRPPTC